MFRPKKEQEKLTVSVQPQDNELTTKNNASSEFISIIDFKRKTVIFAGAPSPDVSFIRRVLEQEQGSENKVFIQKQGPPVLQSTTRCSCAF
jgi:acyl CoA:acetate/3-ketoacid CoA transferase